MAEAFVAEIRIFPFNFAPKGWALCDGQILPISQNTALFSLLGTTYGGNGQTDFALPNLQGSAPLHIGGAQPGPGLTSRSLGEAGGEQSVSLLASQMPSHTHTARAAASGGQGSPAGNVWASAGFGRPPAYTPSNQNTNVQMNPKASGVTGGSLPHNNMPPYVCLNFCIALVGTFPTRS
jgi:microcystin-dependent protein